MLRSSRQSPTRHLEDYPTSKARDCQRRSPRCSGKIRTRYDKIGASYINEHTGLPMRTQDMKPPDVTALCTAAQEAWNKLPPHGRKARFSWRGVNYIASHTQFRLLVRTARGEPVACRWD